MVLLGSEGPVRTLPESSGSSLEESWCQTTMAPCMLHSPQQAQVQALPLWHEHERCPAGLLEG